MPEGISSTQQQDFARVLASGDHVEISGSFWAAWPDEPLLFVLLVVTGSLYVLGWRRLHRVGAGGAMAAWRTGCFFGALIAIGAALISPIAVYSERLFFMHMIQHMLLLLVAPPLIWLGSPLLPMIWALPRPWRQAIARQFRPGTILSTVGRVLAHPATALAAYVATVAIWHIPRFYDAAQGRSFTHNLEHVCFVVIALLYWWPIIYPAGGRRRLSYAWAIPYLLPPMLEGILIGALITFADRPLYNTYVDMEPVWGFSTRRDQELGGLIMWVPGGILLLIPLLGLLALALRQSEGAGPEPGNAGRRNLKSSGSDVISRGAGPVIPPSPQ